MGQKNSCPESQYPLSQVVSCGEPWSVIYSDTVDNWQRVAGGDRPVFVFPYIYATMLTFISADHWQTKSLGVMATSYVVACHITKLSTGQSSFRQILQFRENQH